MSICYLTSRLVIRPVVVAHFVTTISFSELDARNIGVVGAASDVTFAGVYRGIVTSTINWTRLR